MNISKKQFVTYTATISLVCIIIGVAITSAATPTTTFNISGGIYPGTPSYTIWREGSNYFAKDAHGQLSYSGTNVSQISIYVLASGNSIYYTSGTYVIDTAIPLVSNLAIYGNGLTTTFYVEAAANFGSEGVFNGTNVSNITISNLKIDGNKAGQSSGFSRGIYLVDCDKIIIERVLIVNAVFCGIDIRGCTNVQISNSETSFNTATWVTTAFGAGVYIRNDASGVDSDNVIVSNIIARYNGNLTSGGDGSGLQIYGQKSTVSIDGAICTYNARYGIKSQCGNLTITNSHTNYNDYGIAVSTGLDANTTQIIACEALNNTVYGIYITAPAIILGCEVAYTSGDGIRVDGYAAFQGIIIEACNVHDNLHDGIDIEGVNYTVVSSCNSWNNGQNGIQLDDYGSNPTYWSIVSACVGLNNGAYGIREASGAAVDYNMITSCNVEGNTFDGIPLTGTNSRVFNCWNGTNWQNDTP